MRRSALVLENFDGAPIAPAPAPAPAEAATVPGWAPSPMRRMAERADAPPPAANGWTLPDFADEPSDAVRRAAEAEAAAAAIEVQVARARGEGRAEGFAAGAADAEARGAAELRLMLAELSEQIDDIRQAQAEREAALHTGVRDVAEALLTGVAPAFARGGLAAEVAAAAAQALRPAGLGRSGADALVIRVAPGQAEAVAEALRAAGLQAPVAADPALDELHARLDWGDGEDVVDLAATLSAAGATLARHFSENRSLIAHG